MKKERLTMNAIESFKEGYKRGRKGGNSYPTINSDELLFVDPKLGNNEQFNVHIATRATINRLAGVRYYTFFTLSGLLIIPVIEYSEKLNTCPEFVIKFITSHEVGHVNNKDDDKTYKKREFERIFHLDPSEAAADLFAAKHVGKESAIEALKYMKQRVSFISALEIGRRIKALERAAV